MTIHVPRWLLLGVLALVVVGGVAAAGYLVGHQRGEDEERAHASTQHDVDVQAGRQAVARVRVSAEDTLMTHHKYELFMLRATCRYVNRLHDAAGRGVGTFPCVEITPPPGDHVTIYGHNYRVTDVLGQICSAVAIAATGRDFTLEDDHCRPDPSEVTPLHDPKLERIAAEALTDG